MEIDEDTHELKFVDFTVTNDAFTNVWTGGEMEDATALSISAIAQGDSPSSRDGRTATLISWKLNGFINIAAVESITTPLPDQIARICVVLDTQTNGAQLNAEDVMDTIAATFDVNSMETLSRSKRFVILEDILLELHRSQTNEGAINLFASGIHRTPFKIGGFFNPPIRVNHSGTAAAIASIVDNSIHVIGTATNAAVLLNYRSRVRFID